MFVEKTFAVLIAAVYGFTSVWVLAEAKFIPLGSEVWIFGVALVPVGLSVHALRKSFLSKHQLLTALTNFELESSTCSSDFDRRFILRCIRRWYGGPEQFESFVRKDLREELLAQIRQTSFRSGYYLVTVVPSVCAGLDSLVCLWRGQAPTEAVVTHFVCLVLAFDICWIVITFRLVLLLSDGSAQLCLRFRFLNYAISLMIFLASGMLFMVGLVGSRLARNTLSVSTAVGWLALSCILMALTSDSGWRQVRALRRRSKV
ncbi:FRQ1 [Symbiodinium necroappetens]|uniref:FRQ1 protein n=1 Tax=Symbiodinium necroappetens TaxID=1628268 RepID=A0A812ZJB5_9DINO|nr:FRQ1 [Symbiodinium necroappetens]